MRRLIVAGLLAVFLAILMSRAAAPLPVYGETLPEETRKLLEKSLSVVEIDREIARISSLRLQTREEIDRSQARLAQQEIAIAVQREQAGRVLRAYYMGQKELILGALLSAQSLPELFRAWEAIDLIITSDRAAMDRYAAEYAKLREGYEQLRRDQAELAEVESNLQAQRARLIELQKEVDRALSASGDEAHLRQLMAELEAYWKNIGMFEVKRHFRALAEAMQELPEWIQKNPDTLERKGLKAKLTITDAQLNEFLRERGEEFRHFRIAFEQDRMTLSGDNGDLQVAIGGHYSIEDEPENAIRFHVDSLSFNGLELPDTTRAELEREFDLGFYPGKLIRLIKADSVELTPGRLTVQLKIG